MNLIAIVLMLGASVTTASSGQVAEIFLKGAYSYVPAAGNQRFDEFWVMQASIGTPPQQFSLVPDTGSPDTWVQGKQLVNGPVFKPKESSTFVNESKPWKFEYSGPLKSFIAYSSGYAARDTIAVGLGPSGVPASALVLKNTTFAVAEKSTVAAGFGGLAQGIFGLTHDMHASSYNAPPYPKEAAIRGKLKTDLFGIHLRRADDTHPDAPSTAKMPEKVGLVNEGGKITLGGIDHSQFKGPVTYAPIELRKGFWQFAIDGIYVNGNLIKSTENFNAIADTGTTPLILNPKQSAEFFSKDNLDGTLVTPKGSQPAVYTLPCNRTIDVQVKIGGRLFPIKAQDLNGGYTDKTKETCNTNFVGIIAENASKNGTYPTKAKDIIVLGAPLLLNTYSIFDYTHGNRVGFAELVDGGTFPTIAPLDVAAK